MIATYQTTPSKDGNGTFFFTDCGHEMYSVKNSMAYHNKLCPACLSKGVLTTLYLRGTKEAKLHIDSKTTTGVIVYVR